jgi:hypothetical protein
MPFPLGTYLMHCAAAFATVFLGVPWSAGRLYMLFKFLHVTTSVSRFDFLFSHVFGITVGLSAVAGYLVNSKSRSRSASFSWTPAVLMLIFKVLTFGQKSVVAGYLGQTPMQHFFGELCPAPNSGSLGALFDLSNNCVRQFLDQLQYSAWTIGSAVYSAAAYAGRIKPVQQVFAPLLAAVPQRIEGLPSEPPDETTDSSLRSEGQP